MRHLDLADLVALAAEVAEVEGPKLLELLDCAEMEALLGEAQMPMPPHEEAAALLVGLIAIGPLPTGNQRLALLAALQFLALNGLDVDLEPHASHELVAGVADGTRDAAAVAAWLAPRLTARDPLEGALREALTPDAWAAVGLSLLRAYRHGRRLATPADLLMGLFREGAGPAALALGARETDMEPADPLPTPTVPARIPAFDPESRRVLASAFRTSSVLCHHGINSGHLLLGLLDAGHAAVLPDDLDPEVIRQRVLDLLDPDVPDEGDLSGRLTRLAARIRTADPVAAAELEEVADLQRIGLDRLVEMSRAWRGELFLQALARESVVVRLLGSHRLGAAAQDVMDERLLTDYLGDIAQHTRLTRAEELQLGHSIRGDAETLAAESRRRLIEANLQLVVSIARTYEASGIGMLDLIHEGNLGLMEATRHFDPTKGFRFSTYATWWIRKFILEAIARRQP